MIDRLVPLTVTTPDQDCFKCTSLFDVEYLRNSTR